MIFRYKKRLKWIKPSVESDGRCVSVSTRILNAVEAEHP